MFAVKVDDISYWVIENNVAAGLKNIKVFGRDNFYNPAAEKIKNLKIQTEVTLFLDLMICHVTILNLCFLNFSLLFLDKKPPTKSNTFKNQLK